MREFIWDFDGTLMDTYPAMVSAFQRAVQNLGGELTRTEIYTMMRQQSLGFAEREVAKRYGWELSALRAGYQQYEPVLQAPVAFDGAKTVLAKIKAVGGHNYLMTHRDQVALTYLAKADLKQYFDDYVTGEQPFPRKPDPAALNYLLDKNGVTHSEAVMVGDRNLDIEAGHRAHASGYLFDYDQLIEVTSQPEIQVAQLTDLLPLIN
ncbi:HAD-IA family hydrolase [Lactiplantibacillus sp. WILCCON 0030]|uniref:HAD-IA family hydrolase n=1 Tax=Lactiplantibacillus brownii TaxID=3069269 RepID=A0ABU1A985_9LACO|nr:HAD-IA family hydrolase [Lactiplantibacillus brownii]MDQ7937482.1 HAD-IA family hydrolase [Lactiplantibacillus brownii]